VANINWRLIIFAINAILLIILEAKYPYRKKVLTAMERWPGNLGLIAFDNLLLKFFLPLGLVGFCENVQKLNYGLINIFKLNHFIWGVLSFLLLDLAIYFQHIVSHKWKFFWNFHQVHHSDTDLDLTSGLRFHPGEILISTLYKMLIVLVLGISPIVFLIFEIVLNSMAMFNHSNIYIPEKLEMKLRKFIVTPQMHIIHHSVDKIDSDKNYGFNLSIWDRVFRTYTSHFNSSDQIGQLGLEKSEDQQFFKLLIQPINKGLNE
jgi:sterol desaturase/sphingolipid hydroxylase (fatty acid hydroxylase superfamily)